jgi:hypothetical protein
MFPGSFDPTSLILLFIGKDNQWVPLLMVIILAAQKWNKIIDLYNNFMLLGKSQYKITVKLYTDISESYCYGDIGEDVWALIRYTNNILKNDSTLLSNAYNLKLPYNDAFDADEFIIIPASKSSIKLTQNIRCKVDISDEHREVNNTEKKQSIDITVLNFTLSSNKSFESIIEFMNNIIKEYTANNTKKRNKKTYIIKPFYKRESVAGVELQYPRMLEFKSSKSFDNLFFDGKEDLIKRIDAFVARDKYKVLGLPETLGLLFYGDPGTGKTSCIKAVAAYLEMSLIIVPMSQITTKKRLEELFLSDVIGIPQEKRIYVFEEIDCNGWENIIRPRHMIQQQDTVTERHENALIEQLAHTLKPDSKKCDKDTADKLTLGSILEIIDGLVECPGRIIIMTTNHKDHIDPALLRPGRIDMEIEFKKLRRCHIMEIYKKWYGKNIDRVYLEQIPDYKFTQAQISQLLFKYENNSNGFISQLTK